PRGPGCVQTATATLASGAGSTPVTFSILSTLPTGVAASAFTNSPCSPICNATVTLTASTTAPASSTVVTIQATGGSPSGTHATTFTLVICGGFDFTVGASPSTLTITPGGPGGVETATATLVSGCGGNPPVTFSILGSLPVGVTSSPFVNSPCIVTCSATVTLTASFTAPFSSTVMTIEAISGAISVTRTVTFTLVVSQGPFVTLVASPSTLSITPGGQGGVETATATLMSGSTSPLTFSILTTLPSGVAASAFSNSPCSPTCSASVTLTLGPCAPSSSAVITIQASGGTPAVTHTATFTLVVSGFFDLTLAATPATLSIAAGDAGGVETATVTSVGGCGGISPFTLSILTALPTGVTASAFTNSPCIPTCSATVTLTAAANAPASSTVITIQATGGTPVVTHTATFTLVVTQPFFDFSLDAN